jgi:hypothetical protein
VHALTQRRTHPVNLRLLQITQLVTSQHVTFVCDALPGADNTSFLHVTRYTLFPFSSVSTWTVANHIHPWINTRRGLLVLGARVAHAPLLHPCLVLSCCLLSRCRHDTLSFFNDVSPRT